MIWSCQFDLKSKSYQFARLDFVRSNCVVRSNHFYSNVEYLFVVWPPRRWPASDHHNRRRINNNLNLIIFTHFVDAKNRRVHMPRIQWQYVVCIYHLLYYTMKKTAIVVCACLRFLLRIEVVPKYYRNIAKSTSRNIGTKTNAIPPTKYMVNGNASMRCKTIVCRNCTCVVCGASFQCTTNAKMGSRLVVAFVVHFDCLVSPDELKTRFSDRQLERESNIGHMLICKYDIALTTAPHHIAAAVVQFTI